jgi:cyclophilin family peptidyl-prolyl cis-trans isomerase
MRFLSATLALTFAIAGALRATEFPTIKVQLPDITTAAGAPIAPIDLRNHFEITDIVGQVVQFRTNLGNFNAQMLAGAGAATVANFLSYVNGARFTDSFIHRSVVGLGIIQGGGFRIVAASPLDVDVIPTDPPIVLEYTLHNTRGTLAMARTGEPDSATSGWFINTIDNTATFGPSNGGGYAVFARVTGSGMTVVDTIQAVRTYNAGAAFPTLPLVNFPGGTILAQHLVTVQTVEAVPVFPATAGQSSVVNFAVQNTNPALLNATISASELSLALNPGAAGFAQLTITATDTNGNSAQDVFTVTVPAPEIVVEQPAGADLADGASRSFPITPVGQFAPLTFTVRNTGVGGLLFTATPHVAVIGPDAAEFVVGPQPDALVAGPSGATTFTVRFVPTSPGGKQATLQIASNDSDEAVFDIPLTGTAIARPATTTIHTAARTGDSAPGAGAGATFKTFGPPALSDVRDLAARVTLLDGRATLGGIYVKDFFGAGTLAAYQGGPAPGISGVFKSFLDPVLSAGGAIAFAARVQGDGMKAGEDSGVWTDAFGPALDLVLREGSQVPGLPVGARLKAVSSLSLRDGELLALVTLGAAKDVVAASTDTVLLRMTAANAAVALLREGHELAGVPGSSIKSFSVLSPALGSPGHGRWHAEGVVVAKVILADTRTLLVKIAPTGAVTPLLSSADAATPIAAAAQWKSFGLPAVGSAGMGFVVSATLKPNLGGVTAATDTVLLTSADGATWSVLAREGGAAPVTPAGPLYATFFDPVVNAAGHISFLATLQGAGLKASTKTALFAGATPALVARLGSPAPDAAGAPTLAVWSKFLSHALPSGAGAGAIFLAETTGGDTTPRNKLGLWAVDSGGLLRRLLRTGDTPAGGTSQITALTLLNAVPGAFGTTRSFNTTASIALAATFADKTQALLRVDVP